jgi:hypothetical protein
MKIAKVATAGSLCETSRLALTAVFMVESIGEGGLNSLPGLLTHSSGPLTGQEDIHAGGI